MRTLFTAGPLLLPCIATLLPAQQQYAELPRTHLPPLLDAVTAMATLDINADGFADLVLGRNSQPSAVWLGDGHGSFTPGNAGALVRSEATTAFAAGDVNRDGSTDLVWGTAGGALRLLRGINNTLYEASSGAMPSTAAYTTCLALTDVDGDLDLDIVAGGAGSSGTGDRLLANDGTGRFTDVTSLRLPSGGTSTAGIVPFDCDGDADVDLLMVDLNGTTRLLRNSGAGFFAPTAGLPALGGSHSCAAAGDVDADGDLDLVIGRGSASNPTLRQDFLLRNDGSGNFTDVTSTNMPAEDNRASSLHFVDVDQDGDLDLLVGHSDIVPIGPRLGCSLLLGNGAGVFTDASATLPQNDLIANVTRVFDVDVDGDGDFVFTDQRSGGQHIYWNDHGTFRHATGAALPMRRAVTEGVAAGDLDGDGLPELVAAGWNFSILSGRNSLYWNDGTGHGSETAALANLPYGFYSCAAIGDVDGDGDRDLVFGLDQPGQNMLLRNDGARTFTDVTATALPQVRDFTRVVRLFDADGDGDVDLLAGNHGQNTLARNDGAGRFTDITAASLPAFGMSTRDAAVGDVDGDGDPDLVFAVSGGANRLWLNQGNGTFADAPQQMPPDVQTTEAVALADFDGDGDLDLVVGNSTQFGADPRSWLHPNDGTGRFLGPRISLGSTDVQAIAAGDVDGDGDHDFVLGGYDAPLRLFENVGGGSFLNQSAAMPAELRRTLRLVLTDLDGDGDLDLFEGGQDGNRVLFALHRHLHSDRFAVPGGSLALRMHVQNAAPSVQPFGVLAAGFPATTPLPTAFGLARLANAGLTTLEFTVFAPGQTSRGVAVAVPANPGLVGLRIGFQALLAHDVQPTAWRLSGLAAETILH